MLSLQPPWTDAKILLGQDAEGFPSKDHQGLFGATVTSQWESIKNAHSLGEGIVLLLFPLSQGLGAQPVASTAQEEQRPCYPCSRAFFISFSNKSSEKGGNKH